VQVRNTKNGELRVVRTYGAGAVQSDPYYRENLVLGDLPAGLYKITFRWDDAEQQEWATISPGQVTYFTYRGKDGFRVGPPLTPEPDFLPTAVTP
jgi:hypothetical protein